MMKVLSYNQSNAIHYEMNQNVFNHQTAWRYNSIESPLWMPVGTKSTLSIRSKEFKLPTKTSPNIDTSKQISCWTKTSLDRQDDSTDDSEEDEVVVTTSQQNTAKQQISSLQSVFVERNSLTTIPSVNAKSFEAKDFKSNKKGNSREHKENPSQSYKLKKKTELCRNWESGRDCSFGKNCAYAHGEEELITKVHVPDNYKTKLCNQFHEEGYCPYGTRCQFLHLKIQKNIANFGYSDILKENIFFNLKRK